MDGENKKVFVASITRNSFTIRNNFYDIIKKDVAEPVKLIKEVQATCNFTPKCGKIYVPKKKREHKVLTVSDIRSLYEKDKFQTLPYELERQQKLLLTKIRDGFAKDENTRKIALNLLTSDKPMSRSSWQMLMNLNPEGHYYSSQFILWNGKYIQVNGSKGGKNKFICNYDISKDKEVLKKTAMTKCKIIKKRRGLLRDSLNIRFKPGPLRKKKELDYSYQKYHVGDIKLVNLPKPGLDIQPSIGTALEPTIKTFLQNLREEDGTISETWAEFAVSMLGKVSNEEVVIDSHNSVTFNLNYNFDHKKILMRHDLDKIPNTANDIFSSNEVVPCLIHNESLLTTTIKTVLDEMLDSVEISLNQDLMYSGVEEPRETSTINESSDTGGYTKEKGKRKYGELDRLDVTVIRLSENRKRNDAEPCRKLFCALGCICDSLECGYNLQDHCGRAECMFDCKCDFSKYKISNSLDGDCSEFIPGLFYLDKKLNDNLSKEEQKFHQTVLVTDDKSILLKTKRRDWKASKKYADFYSGMRLRSQITNQKPLLSVLITKLKCENIEPWCMVHNLYKCFCKGKFTQGEGTLRINDSPMIDQPEIDDVISEDKELKPEQQTEKENNKTELNKTANIINLDDEVDSLDCTCVRILPFEGRKHSDDYYFKTHEKILQMEKNDKNLHAKLINLISMSCENEETDESLNQNNVVDVANIPFRLDELLNNILHEQEKFIHSMYTENEVQLGKIFERADMKRLPNKTKLVEWLESSYKKYKERLEKGVWKTLLSPPKTGKVALYPWDFILSRYQEKKNLFLISIQKPFRIFMAVDARHPFFERCKNVSKIPLSDINEYPVMVRNLITNTKDLKDNFCILCGLSHCWELIGSVTKVNENKIIQSNLNNVSESFFNNTEYQESVPSAKKQFDKISSNVVTGHNSNEDSIPQMSKWFVMIIENDFSEIQFFIRGFFVKYDSIVKAIQVSRRVVKTVRLSSNRCNEGRNCPQFGIYATPNMSENSVFVGPYEKDELLGIEILKNSIEALNMNKTRGLWITVNKEDNLKVIDNPLSFMPCFKTDCDYVITLEDDTGSESLKKSQRVASTEYLDYGDSSTIPAKSLINSVKLVKPITIRKTDGFYHLASNSLFKHLPFKRRTQKHKEITALIDLESSSSDLPKIMVKSNKGIESSQLGSSGTNNKSVCKKSMAEIAQIKITNIASLCNNTSSSVELIPFKKPEKGMLVLKPEEINKKVVEDYFRIMQPVESNKSTVVSNPEPKMEIEEFLDSSIICTAPLTDVYIISDDEEDYNNFSNTSSWTDVWISCTNINNIGWILGRRNSENKLSFEFPGFAYTMFYEEEEAFNKINQVFSRKVYIPKNITMKWQVIEKQEELNSDHKLKVEDLSSDFVLTKQGLKPKHCLMHGDKKKINDGENEAIASTSTQQSTSNSNTKNNNPYSKRPIRSQSANEGLDDASNPRGQVAKYR